MFSEVHAVESLSSLQVFGGQYVFVIGHYDLFAALGDPLLNGWLGFSEQMRHSLVGFLPQGILRLLLKHFVFALVIVQSSISVSHVVQLE